MPWIAATASMPLGRNSPTRSPRPTPQRASRVASRSAGRRERGVGQRRGPLVLDGRVPGPERGGPLQQVAQVLDRRQGAPGLPAAGRGSRSRPADAVADGVSDMGLASVRAWPGLTRPDRGLSEFRLRRFQMPRCRIVICPASLLSLAGQDLVAAGGGLGAEESAYSGSSSTIARARARNRSLWPRSLGWSSQGAISRRPRAPRRRSAPSGPARDAVARRSARVAGDVGAALAGGVGLAGAGDDQQSSGVPVGAAGGGQLAERRVDDRPELAVGASP